MRVRLTVGTALAAVLLDLLPGVTTDAAAAPAPRPTTMAAVQVADLPANCASAGNATLDQVVGLTATALRGSVAPAQRAGFDKQVNDFRAALAGVRVREGLVPRSPDGVSAATAKLDDPVVTYVVRTLDGIRTGHIDQTYAMSGTVTTAEAIEIAVVGLRVVKIPAEFLADAVPTVGLVLKFVVAAVFDGVQLLARAIQHQLDQVCLGHNDYPSLTALGVPGHITDKVALPPQLVDLARGVLPADGTCTPISGLTLGEVVERTRQSLRAGAADSADIDAKAASVQALLRDTRVFVQALPRQPEEFGPLVTAFGDPTFTFLVGLGASIAEGKGPGDTIALRDVTVGNSLDLALTVVDTVDWLLTGGVFVAGYLPVPSLTSVLPFVSLATEAAFAPTNYGGPILKGLLQTLCPA